MGNIDDNYWVCPTITCAALRRSLTFVQTTDGHCRPMFGRCLFVKRGEGLMEYPGHPPTKEIDPMCMSTRANQASQGNSSAQRCAVERMRVADAPRGTTGAVGESSHSDRFVSETEPVREFLIRHATRLTRQRADAEDLVQETLLKAYISFGSYRDGTQLIAWLSRIMANAWIDRHRSAQRRPSEHLSAEITDPPHRGEPSYISGASRTESAESEALKAFPSDVEMALRLLPDEIREIVYYAYIGGYRNTEIAALLDIPAGTVGSRLHRGRAMLRAALADTCDGESLPIR